MRKLIALLLFTFSIFTSLAQSNFLPGYIIFPGNDSVRGLIDYRNWEKNPRQLFFSKPGNEPRIYTIRELEAFGVDSMDHYKKEFVSLDMNPVRVAEVSSYRNNLIRTDTVFLRVLVKGNYMSLYEFVDFKPHYFIQYEKGNIEELIYRVTKDSGSINNRVYNDFRIQLKKALSARTLTYQQSVAIDKLNYKDRDLIKFVSGVNDPQTVYVAGNADKRKSRAKFFAGGGVVFESFGFVSPDATLNSLQFNNNVSYIITGGIDFFTPRNLQNLVFRGEISLSEFHAEGSGVSKTVNAGINQHNEYSLKQINITPAASLLYNFINLKKAKVYGGLALGYNLSFYPKNILITRNELTGNISRYEDFPELEKMWMAGYAKIGVIATEKFEISLTGQIGGSFVNYRSTGEKSNVVSLRFFYRFN